MFPLILLGLGVVALAALSSSAKAGGGPLIDQTRGKTAEDATRLQYALDTFFAIMQENPALKAETVESAAKYMEYYGRPLTAKALRGRMSTGSEIPATETWPWEQMSARDYVAAEYPKRKR